MFKPLLIGVAVFGLGWGASFGAGVAYGKRGTPAVQAAIAGGQLALRAQGAEGAQLNAGGQAGQGGQGRGITVGSVERVDGKTLYVTGPNNQQVKATLTDQTQITKQAVGTVADLIAGARVTVQPQGQPGPDGTVTAASVSIVPEGAGAGPGSFGQGQPRQGGGQAGQGGQPRQGGS
ncbi:MAG: hypothetical protein HY332_16680 [Chloroflexi bacterium]|nr:hypothetical protein [Chloroflexota bacterium]